jgi:acyl-CoA thioester hydrolase
MMMLESIKELLKEYPVIVPIPIAWGEMDALAHVNNIVYFRYFETARIAYFEKIGFMEAAHLGGVGPILGEASCKFRKPLAYPDTAWVGVRVSEISADRFTMSLCLVSENLGKIAAEGRAVIVAYDYQAKRKADLPELARQRIAAIEGKKVL